MKHFNIQRLFRWYHQQSLQQRTIVLLTGFRFCIALAFILSLFLIDEKKWLAIDNELLFFKITFSYCIFSAICMGLNVFKTPKLTINLPLQITIDIVFVVLLMHAVGGINSGFGILLIVMIVIGSLVSQGRLALYYASVATVCLLLEHSLRILLFAYPSISYTQPVLLSISCFATAWLAHSLGKRMQASELIASKRSIDLENMSQINALVSHEMQDGVIVVDQFLNVKHLNTQAKHFLSFAEPDIEAPLVLSDIPDIAKLYFDWLANEESVFNIQMHHQALKIRFMPIDRHEGDRKLGAVIFIQDWSQLQSKAQQIKLAALGRLTAKIAHEIRNPLSAISHANQLLQEDIIDGENVRVLEIIEDNTLRIDKIIKDVLELNRRDRTRQETIELNKFITDFHSQFCAVEKINPANFTLILLNTPQIVMFDHRHLTQILWNLCKNGWEHSQKTRDSLNLDLKNIVVNLSHIVITDDGDGVPEQSRSKLFEPFYTTKSTGSGLGLYISRELAEANGAALDYENLTQGSAFILQLRQPKKT